MQRLVIVLAAALGAVPALAALETVTFASKDGLVVTGDLYLAHPTTAPLVLLFHQADYSRGEYREIAPRLNKLGFNALAIDQRSGNASREVPNETAARARALAKPSAYIDALPDLEAAVAFARAEGYCRGRLILWGSSYSASLVLKLAGEDPNICDAVLAFSPGEYFWASDFIASSAENIVVPVFICSARGEESDWESIYRAIPSASKVSFIPEKKTGRHGSQALWKDSPGSKEYWAAVEKFLKGLR